MKQLKIIQGGQEEGMSLLPALDAVIDRHSIFEELAAEYFLGGVDTVLYGFYIDRVLRPGESVFRAVVSRGSAVIGGRFVCMERDAVLVTQDPILFEFATNSRNSGRQRGPAPIWMSGRIRRARPTYNRRRPNPANPPFRMDVPQAYGYQPTLPVPPVGAASAWILSIHAFHYSTLDDFQLLQEDNFPTDRYRLLNAFGERVPSGHLPNLMVHQVPVNGPYTQHRSGALPIAILWYGPAGGFLSAYEYRQHERTISAHRDFALDHAERSVLLQHLSSDWCGPAPALTLQECAEELNQAAGRLYSLGARLEAVISQVGSWIEVPWTTLVDPPVQQIQARESPDTLPASMQSILSVTHNDSFADVEISNGLVGMAYRASNSTVVHKRVSLTGSVVESRSYPANVAGNAKAKFARVSRGQVLYLHDDQLHINGVALSNPEDAGIWEAFDMTHTANGEAVVVAWRAPAVSGAGDVWFYHAKNGAWRITNLFFPYWIKGINLRSNGLFYWMSYQTGSRIFVDMLAELGSNITRSNVLDIGDPTLSMENDSLSIDTSFTTGNPTILAMSRSFADQGGGDFAPTGQCWLNDRIQHGIPRSISGNLANAPEKPRVCHVRDVDFGAVALPIPAGGGGGDGDPGPDPGPQPTFSDAPTPGQRQLFFVFSADTESSIIGWSGGSDILDPELGYSYALSTIPGIYPAIATDGTQMVALTTQGLFLQRQDGFVFPGVILNVPGSIIDPLPEPEPPLEDVPPAVEPSTPTPTYHQPFNLFNRVWDKVVRAVLKKVSNAEGYPAPCHHSARGITINPLAILASGQFDRLRAGGPVRKFSGEQFGEKTGTEWITLKANQTIDGEPLPGTLGYDESQTSTIITPRRWVLTREQLYASAFQPNTLEAAHVEFVCELADGGRVVMETRATIQGSPGTQWINPGFRENPPQPENGSVAYSNVTMEAYCTAIGAKK